MDMITKLQQIDARALQAGITLSALAEKAQVSTATIARMRRGENIRLRTVSKLEAKLAEMEEVA